MSQTTIVSERDTFISICLEGARQHERQARSLRRLATRVQSPPEGTEVYVDPYRALVIFETPVPSRAAHSQPGEPT